MKAWIKKNQHGKFELCVDAFQRLTKKEFCEVLSELDGVKILQQSTIFNPREFCSFEYKGETFTIDEDDFDYCYNIQPAIYNAKTLEALQGYFSNLSIPKHKTRPAFWFAGIVLVGLAVYVNLFSS